MLCECCGKTLVKICFGVSEIDLDNPALEFRTDYYCKECVNRI